jgi:hypothetical protein
MASTFSSQPARTVTLQRATLHVSHLLTLLQQGIGDREVMTKLLACWLMVDESDVPLCLQDPARLPTTSHPSFDTFMRAPLD